MNPKTLSKLVKAINKSAENSRDLQELLRSVIRELVEFPGSEEHCIAIYDDIDNELVIQAFTNDEYAASFDFELARQAVQTRKVVRWVAQVGREASDLTKKLQTPIATKPDTQALMEKKVAIGNKLSHAGIALYAPLYSGKEILGVLQISTTLGPKTAPEFFEEEASYSLEVLAGLIATHITKLKRERNFSNSFSTIPEVFISYAREDKDWVDHFRDDLRRRQIKVWYDMNLKADPGENYADLIQTAIKTRHAFLLVLSQHSFTSRAVKNELKMAQQAGKLIVPLKCQPCVTPEWVNEAQLQYLNFWDDYEASLNDLVLKLRQKNFQAKLSSSLTTASPEQASQLRHEDLSIPKAPKGSKKATKAFKLNPNNLAVSSTSFVGRSAELAQVKNLLQSTYLFTIMGAGGTGKTRLVFEVGHDVLNDFDDGVWVVELSVVTNPVLVEQTIIEALGIKEEAGKSLQSSLLAYLRNKHLLLILDNCEHLIDEVAKLVDKLIQNCTFLKVLATSREALNINGETAWRLPSLETPRPEQQPKLTIEQLIQFEAVRLFVERAKAAKPEFVMTNQNAAAVVKICFQLDGIPLAIELAAARVRAMTVEEIAKRLDEPFKLLKSGGVRTAPTRQQTLEALIRWSYDLLPPEEQIIWRRLSVFAGGWTLEAAEFVCHESNKPPGEGRGDGENSFDIEAASVLDLLSNLVNKSLVIADEQEGTTRYRMLEIIKHYGLARLREHHETTTLYSRHATWYLELVEKSEPELTGAEQKNWLYLLENDHDNIRAALTWAIAEPQNDPKRIEIALRICGALWRFWAGRGYLSEARRWLDTALLAAHQPPISDRINDTAWVKALSAAGTIANKQTDALNAKKYYEEGVILARQIGDKARVARFLNNLGAVNRHEGNAQAARLLYEESLALFREINSQQGVGNLLNNLGEVARDLKDYEAAENYLRESIAVQVSLGNQNEIALSMSTYGDVLIDQQKYEDSLAYLTQSLQIFHELGNQELIAYSLEFFGTIASATTTTKNNKSLRAVVLVGAASSIREEIGTPLSNLEQSRLEQRLEKARTWLTAEEWKSAWQKGRTMSLEEAVEYALTS